MTRGCTTKDRTTRDRKTRGGAPRGRISRGRTPTVRISRGRTPRVIHLGVTRLGVTCLGVLRGPKMLPENKFVYRLFLCGRGGNGHSGEPVLCKYVRLQRTGFFYSHKRLTFFTHIVFFAFSPHSCDPYNTTEP